MTEDIEITTIASYSSPLEKDDEIKFELSFGQQHNIFIILEKDEPVCSFKIAIDWDKNNVEILDLPDEAVTLLSGKKIHQRDINQFIMDCVQKKLDDQS